MQTATKSKRRQKVVNSREDRAFIKWYIRDGFNGKRFNTTEEEQQKRYLMYLALEPE